MVRGFNQSELGKYFECIIREIIIYSKYFPDSDMAKSTRIIHHNQLLSYHMKNYGDLGGCYPPRPTASTDNTLLDPHNSS